jgi:hypothetical protein
MKDCLKWSVLLLWLLGRGGVEACDLCAVYRASDANGANASGLVVSVAAQFIPYRTLQFEGREVAAPFQDKLDHTVTHFVLGYNVTPKWGVSLNVPLVHLAYQRTDFRYSTVNPPVLFTESGTETGMGDISVIGRVAILQKSEMDYAVQVNLLGGIKLPTGDSDRVAEEMEQTRIYNSLLPPNTPHDPLGHSIAAVHPHALALGSGSVDGIFGITVNSRWQRLFLNVQAQYYLRTEGRSGFRFGDELMFSGGPGVFVWLDKAGSLSLQANAIFDRMGRDKLDGVTSDRTGSSAWYLGPILNATWGDRLTANLGVELPLRIENGGYQAVADLRVHGGVAWRF